MNVTRRRLAFGSLGALALAECYSADTVGGGYRRGLLRRGRSSVVAGDQVATGHDVHSRKYR